jgi:uncharacterized protein (DUF2267 family)
MQYDEFIARVQQQADFSSPGEAVLATRATLETLGERLSRVETRQFATQLPTELQGYVHQRPEGQIFALEEFFNRVSAREGVRWQQAVAHARAVMAVVCEAVSPGEIEDMRRELGPEYEALFVGNQS